MSALHDELASLLALVPDQTPVVLAGRRLWSGHLAGHEVVLGLSGIGKVAAATTAALALQHFAPQAVWFTGVAGGVGTDVQVGDVVVATGLAQHDMDASPLFARHEVPGYGRSCFATDPVSTQALHTAAQSVLAQRSAWLPPESQTVLGLGSPRVHAGLLLSGDRFVATAADNQSLRRDWPQALAVDMETAAVAQVCHDFGVPFAAMRTVSDRADDAAHVDFPVFLQHLARHYSVRVVQEALAAWPPAFT